ncbi:MAG: TonB-dependent receptor plug domain-containing protein, partial [Flavobacteriaceae bacterium]
MIPLFLCMGFLGFSQGEPNITANFGDIPLKDALLVLEEQSGYQFYFLDPWVDDTTVSTQIANKSLSDALAALLGETNLNFHMLPEEKRVILVENTSIYDQLPTDFFGKREEKTTAGIEGRPQDMAVAPVFFNDNVRTAKKGRRVFNVGKTDAADPRTSFLLRGTAYNRSNGEVIPDLAIRPKGTNRVSVTDQAGRYSIELPKGYNVLSLTAMGIENTEYEVVLYNNGSLDLHLDEGVERLNEVVVEADAAQNVETAVTGNENISSEGSKNIPLVLGERDVLQVAKTLPGITSAGEGASGFNVRGGKTDQNLILLDHATLYNPTHFFGIFQALNPFTTDKVDIYKGHVPVEYGGRLSSVFDIHTKKAPSDALSGEGSVGPVTANLALGIPVKKDTSSLIIGGRAAYANWILRSLDEESLNNSEASFYDGIVKYHTQPNENNELKATGYFSGDRFSITSDSIYKYSNALASVLWNRKIDDRTNSTLFLGNSDYRFGIDFDGPTNTDFDLRYGINQTQFSYYQSKKATQKHTLTYGISANYYAVNPGNQDPAGPESDIVPIQVEREHGFEGVLFIGDQYEPSDKWLFDVGLRYAFFAALGDGDQRVYAPGQPKNESTVTDVITYGKNEVIKTYGGPEVRVAARYKIDDDLSLK